MSKKGIKTTWKRIDSPAWVLEEQFPKGKCKERGQALMLHASWEIYHKSQINLLKADIKMLKNEK